MARYLIGIDLGTTNSALAYIDTQRKAKHGRPEIQTFAIPQLVAPGELAERPTCWGLMENSANSLSSWAAKAADLLWPASGSSRNSPISRFWTFSPLNGEWHLRTRQRVTVRWQPWVAMVIPAVTKWGNRQV